MRVHAVLAAGVWLSPPILLAASALVLTDGGRGSWPPTVLAVAACLVAVLLGPPWRRLPGPGGAGLAALVRRRWPEAGLALVPLTAGSAGSALLFLWAQIAAAREVAQSAGWPAWTVAAGGLAALGLAAWRERLARLVAIAGAGLALAGAVVPFAAVAAVTDPAWPRVWERVAARGPATFAPDRSWSQEGWPVRGGGDVVTLAASEAQRVTLLGRGRVRIVLWEGGGGDREVAGATDVALRPGDRLIVPEGFPIRFQPGRTIPGTPPSGPEWLSPPRRPGTRWGLAGLGVTLLLGSLGLAPVHAALPAAGTRAGARLGAALSVVGLVAVMAGSVYAAWLTPEVYTGGVAGSEVYELPRHVPALGGARILLADLARLGLAGGGIAGVLLAARALTAEATAAGAGRLLPVLAAATTIAAAAALTRPAAWSIVVAAFGVAAAATAPAAVLTAWRERLEPRALAAGAAMGLAVFVALTLAAASGLVGPEGSWTATVAAWPAVPAAAANALLAWLLSAGRGPSPRSPLPAALADLHS